MDDMGHHIIYIVANDKDDPNAVPKSKSVDLYLRIFKDPEVSVQPNQRFYYANIITEFKCQVQGHPISRSSLQWTYTNCNSSTSCDGEKQVIELFEEENKLHPVDGLMDESEDFHYEYESVLRVNLTQSGVYACKVCSLSDPPICSENNTTAYLNEYTLDGFVAKSDSDLKNVIEKDKVELFCAGSIYDFVNVTWYKKSLNSSAMDLGKLMFSYTFKKSLLILRFNLVSESENISILNSRSKFSRVSIIKFDKVGINDGAEYHCRGFFISDPAKYNTLILDMKVLKAIKPQRETKSFNMNQTIMTKKIGDSVKLDCSIKSDARPTPIIQWTKDNQPFYKWKNSSVNFSKDNSTIIFLAVTKEHSGEYQCKASNRAGFVIGTMIMGEFLK